MDVCSAKLTVLFEDPFWIGVVERIEADRLTACKITFGPNRRITRCTHSCLKTTIGWRSVRLSKQRPKRKSTTRSECKGSCGSKPQASEPAPVRSRRCKCSAKQISLRAKRSAVNRRKRKSSVSLNCIDRSNAKSIGAGNASVLFLCHFADRFRLKRRMECGMIQ